MLRTLLALSLALVAAPTLAQDAKAIGFTQDGEYFVVAQSAAIGSTDIRGYFVFDARLGQLETEEFEGLKPAQFQAWAAKNPLAPLKTGPKSPDGKRTIEATKGGSWKNGLFVVPGVSTWTGSDAPAPRVPPPTPVTFSVKTGKKRSPSLDWTFEHQNIEHAVEPVWSPDGKRVAYLVHTSGVDTPTGDYGVAFGPTQGPRVQVLRVEGVPDVQVEQALSALEDAGLVPVASGDAKGEHPTNVIFAAKGFEADAKKVAASLTEARVDKLTWKPGYELVVVVVDSNQSGPRP